MCVCEEEQSRERDGRREEEEGEEDKMRVFDWTTERRSGDEMRHSTIEMERTIKWKNHTSHVSGAGTSARWRWNDADDSNMRNSFV